MNKTETTYNNTDVIEKVEEIYIRVDELYDDIKYENYVSSSWKKLLTEMKKVILMMMTTLSELVCRYK